MSLAVQNNMSSPEYEQTNDFNLFPDSPMMLGQPLQYTTPQFSVEGYYPGLYNQGAMRGMNPASAYIEAPQFPHDSPHHNGYPSTTASGQSSAVSSPHSMPHHTVPRPEWNQMELAPAIVEYDSFALGGGYQYQPSGMEEFALFQPSKSDHFVDPSILHPTNTVRPSSATQSHDTSMYPAPSTYPGSPSVSQMSRSPYQVHDSQSPYMHPYYSYPNGRRPSVSSHQSYNSQEGTYSGDESNEKGRCNYPDCGKVFKDLKAHMLTHQSERPEKCPIITCEYHTKGFARKYDKNRHTLTHYKGTMVCGFCPGSGSAAEKSFNRADVFKRHLTSVHSVEQTPPNSRKKTTGTTNNKKLTSYAPDATGKCSTCSSVFSNAQEFYEHLDDCVLRIVQQEEPSEAINAARLAEVEKDRDVHDTLRNHALPTTTKIYSANDEDDEDDDDDEDINVDDLRMKNWRKTKTNRNPVNGVQKSRGLTHSKGGVTLHPRGRKKRKDYPSSWGCPSSQMKMKKRVLTVFDGPRRLWKDDMMLDTDYEVRMKLSDEKSYVTDLDIQSMRRAEALHNADEEEKGPWISDDLTGLDLEKLMEVNPADES